MTRTILTGLGLFFTAVVLCSAPNEQPPRQMENLGRGVVAVPVGEGKVFVGWRLLGTDPEAVAFNLYRKTGEGNPVKVNDEPIAKTTHFLDARADLSVANAWFVRPVLEGREQETSAPVALKADSPERGYLSIPLQTLPGHTPNDASVGDLDGDGEFEIVLKQEMRPRDNSQSGATGETKLEAYKFDGAFLWRINLGRNIREGAHYTQFLVYDLDGDGRAEVVCKTGDGMVDGKGTVMHDPQYRLSVAWQNVGYNQPTQPGFYLGDGMKSPLRLRIATPTRPKR